ncbi:MAG: hypothetical protein IJ131_05975, partial [Eggerthellaceae bacterium]|nr:hypothetical protein [Eggerthellaceae bacterium]
MAKHKSLCLVCGEEVVYSEDAFEVTCALCGKQEKAHAACAAGHYVCDSCHREEGVKFIMNYCRTTDSVNPVQIIIDVMGDKSIFANGPEHHTLFGAALIAAYANAGGTDAEGNMLDKDAALDEMLRRSMQLPGGTCGFWGVCSAAVSVGQALSILNGSTPMKDEPWAQCQALTSDVLGQLAEMGGPRCCKRNGFTSVITAVKHIEKDLGVSLEMPEKVVCTFFPNNAECKRAECPYFP